MSAAAYAGEADREIDGRGFMVMPGLVNIHSHPSSEPLNKGWNDEIGSPKLYNSSLYEYHAAASAPMPRASRHLVQVALSELLMSGVTTLVDLSVPHRRLARPGGAERHARRARADVPLGALVHATTAISSKYEWDEAAGRRRWTRRLTSSTRPSASDPAGSSGMVVPGADRHLHARS